jgi:hypothetical protein
MGSLGEVSTHMSSALIAKLVSITYIPSGTTFAHGDRFAIIAKY